MGISERSGYFAALTNIRSKAGQPSGATSLALSSLLSSRLLHLVCSLCLVLSKTGPVPGELVSRGQLVLNAIDRQQLDLAAATEQGGCEAVKASEDASSPRCR